MLAVAERDHPWRKRKLEVGKREDSRRNFLLSVCEGMKRQRASPRKVENI